MPEQTFTNLSAKAAALYALNRGDSYPAPVYDAILSYTLPHSTSSFASTTKSLILDVGTGPGKVLYNLLPFFDAGLGTDSSQGMIEAAKADERHDQAITVGKDVRFEICCAEDVATLDGVQGSVDLIVCAMAVSPCLH